MTMTVAAPIRPEAALQYCRTVTRARARNFYYGLKLLPEPKRGALYAIYAWMRRADDIVDDADSAGGDLKERLESFGQLTEAAIEGRPADEDPLWEALAYTAAQFPLPAVQFRMLLEGQLDDVRLHRYETFEALRRYCHRVASTVGILCIEVWGYSDPAACGLASDRGIAFQLTNIIRDFAQDYDQGRLYLPLEDFRAARLEPEALRRWERPDLCAAFMQRQIERAAGYYQRSAALEELISADCRPTLWAMTSIYRGLLDKAARDPSRLVLGGRLRLSSLAKAGIALRARWMANGSGRG
jgi:phytoene synthase